MTITRILALGVIGFAALVGTAVFGSVYAGGDGRSYVGGNWRSSVVTAKGHQQANKPQPQHTKK
jgi:hypothetical protein